MAKIDLHLHTAYSERPSEWFLQRLGAKESYSEPEQVYSTAQERGMDFVAVTDHNRIEGALMLKALHPERVIVGVEATTYFPEDGCKIHLLLYDIDERQFTEIQRLRENIYALRDYIVHEDIAYSVAHATYAVNKRLRLAHLEKLILLFDVFEGINGARSYAINQNWMDILTHLTPQHLARLEEKHNIAPIGADSWIKAFTAGSDDHAGLFVGLTYTEVPGRDLPTVVDNLKRRRTLARGRHNDYKYLALTIYKIALDFTRVKNASLSGDLFYAISNRLFQGRGGTGNDEILIEDLKRSGQIRGGRIAELVVETIEEVHRIDPAAIEERFDAIYHHVSDIVDEFFRAMLVSLNRAMTAGDLAGALMNLSGSLTGVFLTLPFLSSLQHMYHDRDLLTELRDVLGLPLTRTEENILWFTDTIHDLNGVAETLRETAWKSFRSGRPIRLVTAATDGAAELPPTTLGLPTFLDLPLPLYETQTLHFPSLLKSVEIVHGAHPTQIYISTPGPIGLLGLLCAKLLKVRCVGVYHTDFARQIHRIEGHDSLTELVERLTRWFYSQMDTIKVSSREYLSLLKARGFDARRLEYFPKQIDAERFRFDPNGRQVIRRRFGLTNETVLLFAGRISNDKGISLLAEIQHTLRRRGHATVMLIAGDGPDLSLFRERTASIPGILFMGRVPREDMPAVYSAADIFVFPSTTDTFGMVVMEAQSCGLPAVVSDTGGPQEIIVDSQTGAVARQDDVQEWVRELERLLYSKYAQPTEFEAMRTRSRLHILDTFGRAPRLEEPLNTISTAM